MVLSISNEDNELEVPIALLDEIEAEVPSPRRERESERILRLKYAGDPVFSAISAVSMPVFLGLDRRNGSTDDYSADAARHDLSFSDYGNSHRDGRHLVRGALRVGIRESQQLVQDAFRRVRKLHDMQSERLRKKLLLTGFEYTGDDLIESNNSFFDSDYLAEEDWAQQRSDLIAALVSVGIEAPEAEKELNPFFDKVIALAKRLATKKEKQRGEALFEVVLNRASIMRLKKLVEVVRDFNRNAVGLTHRLESFVKCLNFFLVDSRKELKIDSVGILKFARPDKIEVPVEALSSGERQLLIMFSHLFFNSFGDKSNVFVIDEPEVSLHLRWQDALLEKMQESSPRAQIIIATHSPEIVGELKSHCTGVS